MEGDCKHLCRSRQSKIFCDSADQGVVSVVIRSLLASRGFARQRVPHLGMTGFSRLAVHSCSRFYTNIKEACREHRFMGE